VSALVIELPESPPLGNFTSQLARTGVAVEKLVFCTNGLNRLVMKKTLVTIEDGF
jgi:hypothetical protein